MKAKKPSRKELRASCDEIRPDDGVDPRTYFRGASRRRTNRKALQLCGEVARTLGAVLAWESGDEVLRGLVVEAVEPAPDATRLLVTVAVHGSQAVTAEQVLAHLHRAVGRLRAEVAAAVRRKRAPELVFRVGGRGEGGR